MELVGNSIGFGKGVGRKSQLGFATILGNHLLQWTIWNYGTFGFGMRSSCSRSSSSDLSLESVVDWF
jgi:hypothetical protein